LLSRRSARMLHTDRNGFAGSRKFLNYAELKIFGNGSWEIGVGRLGFEPDFLLPASICYPPCMNPMTFEDLESWQKARHIVCKIYKLTRAQELCRDFGLCTQLQRAAVSIMSNIAE